MIAPMYVVVDFNAVTQTIKNKTSVTMTAVARKEINVLQIAIVAMDYLVKVGLVSKHAHLQEMNVSQTAIVVAGFSVMLIPYVKTVTLLDNLVPQAMNVVALLYVKVMNVASRSM